MPWSRLKTNRPSELDLRRHSAFDPPQLVTEDDPNGEEKVESGSLGGMPLVSAAVSVDRARNPDNERPMSPAESQRVPRRRPFSMLRFRHASDPQLSRTAQQQAPPTPHLPDLPLTAGIAPAIITTAPTVDMDVSQKKKSSFTLPRRAKAAEFTGTLSAKPSRKVFSRRISTLAREEAESSPASRYVSASNITFGQSGVPAPPAYGDDTNSTLALPVSRLSESSRSDGSSGDHGIYATTTTTHTVSTTTTFFRLPRRKKTKGSLFPLPVKLSPPDQSLSNSITPRISNISGPLGSPRRLSPIRAPPPTTNPRSLHAGHVDDALPSPLPSPSHPTFGASSISFPASGNSVSRRESTASRDSAKSSPVWPPPVRLSVRGRSSTMASLNAVHDEESLDTPPLPQSSRTSTSTAGRSSFGALFNLARLRQNSEPPFARHASAQNGYPGTPVSQDSKGNSFSLKRESMVIPERKDGDTPAKYLVRLEETLSRGTVAGILSRSNDEFSKNVLRSYMRGFKFFGDPLDMSVRKLLMEVVLPKETQHIDRVLQSFADRYHECNPGIFASPDEAYFIAFSILILHTDVFNKSNKHKMQKQEYTRNASGQGVADQILECFYDNISYTPFIRVDDDMDFDGERRTVQKSHKSMFKGASTESLTLTRKVPRGPLDPYALILDNKLDTLRPTLKDVMNLDDPYSYLGTATSLNLADLHRTFYRSGVLQIISPRSRPDAFTSQATMDNPAEAHPGVVDIKVTKVGILWRKDTKKKKTRSPWQEWGAVLTGIQLYFFRNTTWIKNLMHQHDTHHKYGSSLPVTFKPPLEQFKPDVMMSTEDAVALVDNTYRKHKNAFVFVRHGGVEETLLADNESDMNDWLAKLNYAAAFRTSGAVMRGVGGGIHEEQRLRVLRRMESGSSSRSISSPTSDLATPTRKPNKEYIQQLIEARRGIVLDKITEADLKLGTAGKLLDAQLRNARHLQILAPIQNKTREHVIHAAGMMAAQVKWSRIELWRTRCHRDILAMDLEEDMKSSSTIVLSPTPMEALNTPALNRLDSKATSILSTDASPRAKLKTPSAEPSSSGECQSLNDVVRPSSHGLSAANTPKSHNSWELPPLTFEQTIASSRSGNSSSVSHRSSHQLMPYPATPSNSARDRHHSIGDIATRLVTPTSSTPIIEQEILREDELANIAADGKPPATTNDGGNEGDQDKLCLLETDQNDTRTKVRRSLQRTLRDVSVPTHHRSRKGKDSGSSAAMTEDASSLGESEGLTRGAGSFTVHGKKASVITFGSEWQSMSPEERLKTRKPVLSNDVKLSVPSTIDDRKSPGLARSLSDDRPVSAISGSTTTIPSLRSEGVGDVAENTSVETKKDGVEGTVGASGT